MASHVKTLGILHLVFGCVGILGGLIAFVVLGSIAGMVSVTADLPEAWTAVPVLTIIGGFVLMVSALLALPALILGVGLINFRPWARPFGIVLCALELLMPPFGTLLGAYGLWTLLSNEGTALLEQRPMRAPAPYMK